MEQENTVHKKILYIRCFKLTKNKNDVSSIVLNQILLYDFELTKRSVGLVKEKEEKDQKEQEQEERR